MNNFEPSAVTVDSCHKITNPTSPFILVIRKGEKLIDSLIKCAEITNIHGASLLGIGAVENPILGNYNFETKKHEHKTFTGIYELTNVAGNITKYEGKHIAHVHITIANLKDINCASITGHLIEAPIGILAEITIIPFATPIMREFNHELQGATIKIQ